VNSWGDQIEGNEIGGEVYRVLVAIPEGERPLGRSWRRKRIILKWIRKLDGVGH
jgi:hypothetical protein